MTNSERKLLVERIVGYPDYMTLSSDAASNILSATWAIFTSSFKSLKLLGHTLALNVKVIANSFKGDQAAINKNFSDFETKRDEIHAGMQDDLKYFRSAVGDNPLSKGIAMSVAFAANPFLGVSMMMSTDSSPSSLRGPSGKREKQGSTPVSPTRGASGVVSNRLASAMQFFGYRSDSGLNEVAAPVDRSSASSQSLPALSKDQQAAAVRLQSKAKQFFKMQIAMANQLMASMVPQIEAVNAVLRAEDYQQLVAAVAAPALKDFGINVSSIVEIESSIASDLEKRLKEDPEKLAEEAAKVKKKFPNLQAKDDVEILKKASFILVKSPAQQSLMKIVKERSNKILESMDLPLSPESKNLLIQTPEGKQYVDVMDALTNKIQVTSQRIGK